MMRSRAAIVLPEKNAGIHDCEGNVSASESKNSSNETMPTNASQEPLQPKKANQESFEDAPSSNPPVLK